MIGAGTVINPIIKIVTAVAILAAVGYFIVRPILDTTNKAIDSAGSSIRQAQAESRAQSERIELEAARARAGSYVASLQSTWPAAAREAQACVRQAETARAMDRCAEDGQKLVHTVAPDRNFALSYADSLAAQGRDPEAARVRDCVKRASFAPAAMQRCRNLADHLLFG